MTFWHGSHSGIFEEKVRPFSEFFEEKEALLEIVLEMRALLIQCYVFFETFFTPDFL